MLVKKNQKYILFEDDSFGCTNGLWRIKAVRDFGNVKKDDIGGYVDGYHNLSQKGNCWIYDSAKVYDNAMVQDNAKIKDYVLIKDNAKVFEDAVISGECIINHNVKIHGHAEVGNDLSIFDKIEICGNAVVKGFFALEGSGVICGEAEIIGDDGLLHCDKVIIEGSIVVSTQEYPMRVPGN